MLDRLRTNPAANPAVQAAPFALLAARGYTAFTRGRHNVALRRG